MARSAAKGHCDRVLRYVVSGSLFMESGFCRVLGSGDVDAGGNDASDWESFTAYFETDLVVPTIQNGLYYECTVAGVSGEFEPIWPTTVDDLVDDGSASWKCMGVSSLNVDMYYPVELRDALAALAAGSANVSWLDWLRAINPPLSTSRVYVAGMPSLALYNSSRLSTALTPYNHSAQCGKWRLLAQAAIGTRALNRTNYDGPTIPE